MFFLSEYFYTGVRKDLSSLSKKSGKRRQGVIETFFTSARVDSVFSKAHFEKAKPAASSSAERQNQEKASAWPKQGHQNDVKWPRCLWKGHPCGGLILPALGTPGWVAVNPIAPTELAC